MIQSFMDWFAYLNKCLNFSNRNDHGIHEKFIGIIENYRCG